MNPIVDLIAGSAAKITSSIGDALNENITNEEEKLAKKNELAVIVEKSLTDIASYQRDAITAELSGNALQRNWRPITMLTFAFIVVYRYFIAPVCHLELIEMPVEFWDLLKLGMGGYVIGRSVEKVSDTLTKNVDLSFLKKRDRSAEIIAQQDDTEKKK